MTLPAVLCLTEGSAQRGLFSDWLDGGCCLAALFKHLIHPLEASDTYLVSIWEEGGSIALLSLKGPT